MRLNGFSLVFQKCARSVKFIWNHLEKFVLRFGIRWCGIKFTFPVAALSVGLIVEIDLEVVINF